MGNIVEFLRENFYHVAPILVAGAIGLMIIVERAQALSWNYPLKNSPFFFKKIRDLVVADRVNEAISLCERYRNKPVIRVAKEALLRAHQPESQLEDGVELAVIEATQQVQVRTPYLATIANVATLLGLFGTIVGLIHSFEAVGHANAQQKSALLAAGISTAMNATMLGLAIAIPSMIAYSILINKTNHLISEIEKTATLMVDIINQRYFSGNNPTHSGQPHSPQHSRSNRPSTRRS